MKKLFDRLTIIAMHRKNERNMDRGRDCIKEYSLKPDPEWQYKFFHTLLELVRLWGKGKTESDKPLPKKYTELYKALQAQKVFFPLKDEFISLPPQLISNSGVQEPPPAGLFMHEPDPHSAVHHPPQPDLRSPVAPQTATAPPKPQDNKRATDFVSSALKNICSIRENIVTTAMSDPNDDSSAILPDLAMYIEILKSSGEDLFGSPEYKAVLRDKEDFLCKAVATEVEKETEICTKVSQAFEKYSKELKPLELKAELRRIYKTLLSQDLPKEEAPQPAAPPEPVKQQPDPVAPPVAPPSPPESPQGRPSPEGFFQPDSPEPLSPGQTQQPPPAARAPETKPAPAEKSLYSKDSFGPPNAPHIDPPHPIHAEESLVHSDFIDDLLPEGGLGGDPFHGREEEHLSRRGKPGPPQAHIAPQFSPDDSLDDLREPARPGPAASNPQRSGHSNSGNQQLAQDPLLTSSWSGARQKPAFEAVRLDESDGEPFRQPGRLQRQPHVHDSGEMLHQPPFRMGGRDQASSQNGYDADSFDRGSPAFGNLAKPQNPRNNHGDDLPFKRIIHADSEVVDERVPPRKNESSQLLSRNTEYGNDSAWDKRRESLAEVFVATTYSKNNPRPDSSGSAPPPRLQTVLDRVGGPVTTIKLEVMNRLVDKVNAVEGQLRQAEVENRILLQNLGLLEKAFLDAERSKDALVDRASLLNENDERLNSELSNLKTKKQFLGLKLQLKQKLLSDLKKKTTATSDDDEMRRIELTESVDAMDRLKTLKSAEMLRCKRQLDSLEKDYELHQQKKLKAEERQRLRPDESLHQSLLGYSQLLESQHREAHQPPDRDLRRADTRKSLTKGPGSDFLADFNKELEHLINNNSSYSHSYIKY